MSKRRFIVPAFFVFDFDEEDFPEGSEREVYDCMRRVADHNAGQAQGAANNFLNPGTGLLLDDGPTFEVDADSDEWPHSILDIFKQKLAEY